MMRRDITYPDYSGVSDISTRAAEQMRVEGFFDGQPSLMFDEPEGFEITHDVGGQPAEPLKGRSRGWTPVHAQLAALAACTSITIAVVARDQGFRYSDLRTDLRSLIDIRGFFFDLDRQPAYEQLNFDLFLATDEPAERIDALAHETHRRCPQLGLFRLARIPLIVHWHRAGADVPVVVERIAMPEGPTPEERLAAQMWDE
jgi:uncharacterized OsmC-like protein